MGRIVDLCGEIASEAEEGPDGGMLLPPEAWERLRAEWSDDDIEDAMGFVRESLLQSELVEAADSLSARMVELLGTWGEARSWAQAVEGHANVPLEVIGQLARRVERVEEILEAYRDERGPERAGFDELRRRLMDHGIEKEMGADEPDEPSRGGTE